MLLKKYTLGAFCRRTSSSNRDSYIFSKGYNSPGNNETANNCYVEDKHFNGGLTRSYLESLSKMLVSCVFINFSVKIHVVLTYLLLPFRGLITKSKVEWLLKLLRMNYLSWSFQVSNRPFDPCRTSLFLKRLLRNAVAEKVKHKKTKLFDMS